MDTQTFNTTSETLTALPTEIIERARAIAEALSDVQRKELMDELAKGNTALQTFTEHISAITKGFEELLDRTERAMHGLTREEQEQQEHAQEMESIEEQLSPPPSQQ